MRNKHMYMVIADSIVKSFASTGDSETLIQDISNALEIERYDAIQDCIDMIAEELIDANAVDTLTQKDNGIIHALSLCIKKLKQVQNN